ncbi:acyl-CoA dehydrogenase family protein [Kitasatospora sp. GP82]|uniref:acyl-CoA dehydrogenase family protein n=1 Tax=Kitasatospora sp. GP82 TaxID=3035089 RepID=UPI00247423AF|nr:acyl-CoA dehydrogenase family protein [Kitasatospora sp. GP82]MDH6130144.1 3-hydroxy-9,10-secoandrosta-1,3,5(10)-triene-9,17-dione monooxygenase [Kitasatospora sp. GP82]
MTSKEAPSREELVSRAAELVPMLEKNALWHERHRRLSVETVTSLAESGLLKLRVPKRYGGYESDMRTVVDVIAELGRGDGSTAWVMAVWAISSWMAGLFPDEVQDEIFATPDVRVSGILSPTAVAVPTEGGVLLNGKWSFNSGALQSSWNTNAAVLMTPDGPQPIMVAVPLADLQIIDDWHTTGLRGSGSVTTVAADLFVPEPRVLPMVPVLQGRHRSLENAESSIYRAPFMPTACATISAPALGLAKAAKQAFFERLPGRKISYTSYDSQAEAPLTHLQVAEAVTRIDEAEFHAHRAATLLDTKSPTGEAWTLEERARIRLDLGAVCQRTKEAVDILNTASGGSSIYTTVPIQRIERDVQTLNLHAILHPNTNLELYGRIACGLEPNTLYL